MPDGRIRISEAKLVSHPACASAHGSDLQPVFFSEPLELAGVQILGGGRKDFDRIKSELRCAFTSFRQAPENKWSSSSLRNERNCDPGFHDGLVRPWK